MVHFRASKNRLCIYLRWRHQNPWTVEIIRCEEGDVSLSPDTANITVTKDTAVTDHSNFYPFSSLVRYDRKDGSYDVDKDVVGDVAFNYYAFGTSRDDVCIQEGHDYRYNSSPGSLPPTKRICAWCHKKWKADYSGDIVNGEVWHEVDSFENETRSDEELIASWFK